MTGHTAPVARPETCPSCTADPTTARGRYCASNACRCGHDDCPAARSWTPLRTPLANVEPIQPSNTE